MVKEEIRYHIIGAGRGIGRWFAEHLSINRIKLYCYDTAADTLNLTHENIFNCPVTNACHYRHYRNNFRKNDILLLAVPQSVLPALLEELFPYTRELLYVCLTSVQKEPMRALQKYAFRIPPLGCHPLFGSGVKLPSGMLVVITEYIETDRHHTAFINTIRELGLIPSFLTAKYHDKHMGLIQVLPHFCFLVFAGCLSEIIDNPEKLLDLRTPNYQFLHAITCRYLKIASTTTGAIQFTEEAKKVRTIFRKVTNALADSLDKTTGIKDAAEIISRIREPFSGSQIDEGVQIAALALDSIQRFEHLLHRHVKSGDPLVFRYRVTGNFRVVRILRNNSTDIVFHEATIIKDEKYAIGLDAVSRENFKKIGLNFGKPKEETIKKRNIQLLRSDELNDFRRNRIMNLSITTNFVNPHKLNESFFEDWLPKLVTGILSCCFISSYRARGESEKVTLNLIYNARFKKSLLLQKCRQIIQECKL